jgi:hypothetical protein
MELFDGNTKQQGPAKLKWGSSVFEDAVARTAATPAADRKVLRMGDPGYNLWDPLGDIRNTNGMGTDHSVGSRAPAEVQSEPPIPTAETVCTHGLALAIPRVQPVGYPQQLIAT